MHSNSSSYRITQAHVDQRTVNRVIDDQAKVGEWLSDHPRFASALGRIASTDKFMQAYALKKPVEQLSIEATNPLPVSEIGNDRAPAHQQLEVALQNHMSTVQVDGLQDLPKPQHRSTQKVA